MEKKRLMIVDSMTLFRQGLVLLLKTQERFDVVAEAEDGSEALEKARQLLPDLILMDIMPDCSNIKYIKAIKEEMPHVKVVILTSNEDYLILFQALKDGAEGYLLKSMNFEGLARCLKGCFEGELTIPRVLAQKVITGYFRQKEASDSTQSKHLNILSRREKEILQHVSLGFSNKEIGNRLMISESTVKKHLHHILKKLALNNRVQLVNYAMEEKLAILRKGSL
ncbi:MAG: response regulator [Bacillota bacterium]